MPLTETLTRKVGPLPAWGWGAVVVGGYVGYKVLKGRSSGNTSAPIATSSPITDSGTSGGSSGGSSGNAPPTSDPTLAAALSALGAGQSALMTAISAIPTPGQTNAPQPTLSPGNVMDIIDQWAAQAKDSASNVQGGNTFLPGGGNPYDGTSGGAPSAPPGAAVTAAKAVVERMQGYVNTLRGVKNPTAKQKANLATDLSSLAKDKAALAAAESAFSQGGISTGVGGSSGQGIIPGSFSAVIPSIDARNASPESSLTQAEYAATVGGSSAPIDWLAQTLGFQRQNVGSVTYVETLFNRLNFLSQQFKQGNTDAGLQAAIVATQAEINRAEQTSLVTGLGGAQRNVPISGQGGLVAGEGVYVTGSDALKSLLGSAGIGAYPGQPGAAPPAISQALTSGAHAAVPAPTTTAPKVSYAPQISALTGYISALSAVKKPTAAQKTELATYQARLTDYKSR